MTALPVMPYYTAKSYLSFLGPQQRPEDSQWLWNVPTTSVWLKRNVGDFVMTLWFHGMVFSLVMRVVAIFLKLIDFRKAFDSQWHLDFCLRQVDLMPLPLLLKFIDEVCTVIVVWRYLLNTEMVIKSQTDLSRLLVLHFLLLWWTQFFFSFSRMTDEKSTFELHCALDPSGYIVLTEIFYPDTTLVLRTVILDFDCNNFLFNST